MLKIWDADNFRRTLMAVVLIMGLLVLLGLTQAGNSQSQATDQGANALRTKAVNKSLPGSVEPQQATAQTASPNPRWIEGKASVSSTSITTDKQKSPASDAIGKELRA